MSKNPSAMRPRLELTVRTSVRQRVTFRHKLVIAGSTLALTALVAGSIFMYGNFGNSSDAQAAPGSNMGFENGTTEWTAVDGTWTLNTNITNVRSGSKSIKVNVTNGSGKEYKNLLSTITVPLTGTYYIAVTVYAKGSDGNGMIQCGVANSLLGNTVMGNGYTGITSSGFSKVTQVIPVSNGATYSPIISAKRSSNGSTDIYIDDVSMYLTTSNTADNSNPGKPEGFGISSALGVVSFNFTDGADVGSGADGVLILRQSGAQNATATVLNGVSYSKTATVGPTSCGSWSVAYNGASITAGDAPGNGMFTYLVYQKDIAGNFSSSPVRLLVVNGTTTQTISTSVAVDGLFVNAGASMTLTSGNTLTINSGANANISGTFTSQGSVVNNGSVVMNSGSEYIHSQNGGTLLAASWMSGSLCSVTGVTSSLPSGLNQTFADFKWNCPSQAAPVLLANLTASGNVTIAATGTNKYVKFTGTTNIGGNYSVASGATVQHDMQNEVYFNGVTLLQTITSSSNNVKFSTIHTANAAFGVKLLGNVIVSNGIALDNGNFDLNGFSLYTEDGCTVYRSEGSISNGSLTQAPSQPSGKYNVEYKATCITGPELTSSTTYLNKLTINAGISDIVSLDKDATVNGVLALNSGKLRTGVFMVNVKNPLTNAVTYQDLTGYVWGTLRRSTSQNGIYEFPVGSASHGQNVDVKLNNLAGVSYLTVNFNPVLTGDMPVAAQCIANGVGINTLYNAGFWTIHPDNQPTGGTYEVRIRAKGGTNPPASAVKAAVIKRPTSTGSWSAPGSQDVSNASMTNGRLDLRVTGLTSFSDFGIGYGNTTLPITLSAFDVRPDENGNVVITWITSAELNNAYFSVERSSNASDYEEINQQEGNGTSTMMHNYFFTDERPLPGTSYYRLKQVDFDGTFTYSPIRVVSAGAGATAEQTSAPDINVYPNPGHGLFNFSNVATEGIKSEVSLMVFDIKGQMIYKQTYSPGEPVKLDLTAQPPGTYTVTIIDANEQTFFKRLIVQR